jgi:ATP-dependent protease HslVU (ClpYQ) peptidase subunit
MTTIFADASAGVMVCDSKCTNDQVWYPITKVHRVNGELIGIAGDVKEGRDWLSWYTKGGKGARPKAESFGALILRKDGKLYEVSPNGLDMVVERGFHGIGSGGGYAIAAAMAGADPRRAVEIACDIDANSGGEIHVHHIKP